MRTTHDGASMLAPLFQGRNENEGDEEQGTVKARVEHLRSSTFEGEPRYFCCCTARQAGYVGWYSRRMLLVTLLAGSAVGAVTSNTGLFACSLFSFALALPSHILLESQV